MTHRLYAFTVVVALGFAGPALAASVEAGAKVNVGAPGTSTSADGSADTTMQDMKDMGAHAGHEAMAGVKAGAGATKDAAVSTGHKIGEGAHAAGEKISAGAHATGEKVSDGAHAAGKKTKHAAKSVVGATGSALGAVGSAVKDTTDSATSGVSVEANAKVQPQQ